MKDWFILLVTNIAFYVELFSDSNVQLNNYVIL